jgi:aminoglycoside phosphotransferase family enzyme
MCDEEIRLNRRLAPRVYLGVKAVVPTGDRVALAPADDPAAIDYVVEMRRFDETRTLAARVTHGGVPYPALVAVGRALADFHRATPARDGAHATTALTAALAENAETLAELAPDLDFARRAAGLARFMDAFMTARRAELQRRAADARVTAGQTFEGALADDVAPAQHVVLRTDRPEDALDDLAALLDARLGARRP